MKPHRNKDLDEYIYIRLTKAIKKRIKDRAKIDGSNMTIWARQLIIRELDSLDDLA